ncbi:hypothetical protein B5X24_HaOG215931 [Helicoverpa armigera]|nr:hypothetical protein B5X24_HaOG215931 [Helicoverpa armigera]
MYKNYLIILVLAVLINFGNCWQVFPLPDAPAPVKPVDFVKATPVLPKTPEVSPTNEYTPNKLNVRPTSVNAVLSKQNVSVPATDLLPPQMNYVTYEQK